MSSGAGPTQKGCELAAGFEDGRVRYAGRQGCGGDDAHAGDGLETLAGLVCAVRGQELAFEPADLIGEAVELRGPCAVMIPYPMPNRLLSLVDFATPDDRNGRSTILPLF
jgi:hypothetical protein